MAPRAYALEAIGRQISMQEAAGPRRQPKENKTPLTKASRVLFLVRVSLKKL